MSTFLAYFDIGIAVNVFIFTATLLFSQKIKDFFTGVPSEVRAAIKGVEASALGNVKLAQGAVLAQLATALPPVAKPVITSAAHVVPPVPLPPAV